MSGPQRYGQCTNLGGDYWLEENDEGDFVRFADYEALEKRLRAENERLTAELARVTSPEYLTEALTKVGICDIEWRARALAAKAREAKAVEDMRAMHRRAQKAEGRLDAAASIAQEEIDLLTSVAKKAGQWPAGSSQVKQSMERWLAAIRTLPKESADAD